MRAVRIQKAETPSDRDLQRQAVQRMASMVQSEAHWQQILASAATDDQRAELERVVAPMLTFRRAAPCTTPGCESGEVGIWQPVLTVASPLAPEDPSWVPIELKLCDACKEAAVLEDFLAEEIWLQILSAWPDPTRPPVQRLTGLTWDRTH